MEATGGLPLRPLYALPTDSNLAAGGSKYTIASPVNAVTDYVTDRENGLDNMSAIARLLKRVIQGFELAGKGFARSFDLDRTIMTLDTFMDFADAIAAFLDFLSVFEPKFDSNGKVVGITIHRDIIDIINRRDWVAGAKRIALFALHVLTVPLFLAERLGLFKLATVAAERIGRGINFLTAAVYSLSIMQDIQEILSRTDFFWPLAKFCVHTTELGLTLAIIAGTIGGPGAIIAGVVACLADIVLSIMDNHNN